MIVWYLHRLRTMSFFEILYRAKQYLLNKIEKRNTGSLPKISLFSFSEKILPHIKNDYLYSDQIKIFGINFDYTKNIDWHFDLFSSKQFPNTYSKNIDIRTDKFGSAKHVWELNRLLFVPRICLNYLRNKDNKYLYQFINITTSWIENNPYLLGVNWYSNIEVNIRLITWFLCWEILNVNNLIDKSSEFRDFVKNKWLPVIYQHCIYSYKNPSRYSSANNHLISEYAGLFVASSLWKFKESKKWNAYAKKGLEIEIKKQHSENGVNKEKTAEYIQFITDFFLLAYIAGEKTNNKFSSEYKQMLKKIFYYIYQFTDVKGNFPKYGDEDDGRLILLEQETDYSNFKSLLTSGAIIFEDPLLKLKSGKFDIKNQILFGEEGKKKYDSIKNVNTNQQTCFYKKEGHFIIRKQSGDKEIYIHLNAAPLGYLSIAAHGHSDALSFILHLDGKEILVDSGTFSYHTHPDWRQYFRGTLAHNTIRINKKDQALIGGPTLWLKHYKTSVKESLSNEKHDKIIASHNGYKKYGILHTRELLFNKLDNTIIINDLLESRLKKEYFVEFPLHMYPAMLPKKQNNDIFIYDKYDNQKIKIIPDSAFDTTILFGQKSPIIGWYSKSFYVKEPTHVIYQTAKIKGSKLFKTTIQIL
jgi:hypothetical protein